MLQGLRSPDTQRDKHKVGNDALLETQCDRKVREDEEHQPCHHQDASEGIDHFAKRMKLTLCMFVLLACRDLKDAREHHNKNREC